jgi:hypothetical protein
MTIATLRPDGWPQATTVGYVSEGLDLYFLCGQDSQKAHNLAVHDRVSLTIDHDTSNIMAITGLSMAGHAQAVESRAEAERILAPPFPCDADRHFRARLLQGLRTHRSRYLLIESHKVGLIHRLSRTDPPFCVRLGTVPLPVITQLEAGPCFVSWP